MAVVPGRFAVTRMQAFAKAWWELLRCLLRGRSACYKTVKSPLLLCGPAETAYSVPRSGWVGARRASYPNVYFEKIASARLNALSTAACAVIPFLMTSACAWPQSCSALT